MSVGTPEGKVREHRKNEKSSLFISLPVYLFSLPLPCRLRVVHGSGGPGERDERFVSEDA